MTPVWMWQLARERAIIDRVSAVGHGVDLTSSLYRFGMALLEELDKEGKDAGAQSEAR